MKNKAKWLLCKAGLILLVVMPCAQALEEFECDHEAIPPSTPSSDFTVIGDGSIVRHETTGLEWQRCPLHPDFEHEPWNGSECDSGDFGWWSGGWNNALWAVGEYVNQNGGNWRMPNINELLSIVEICTTHLAYNTIVFPYNLDFWTSTPFAAESEFYWRISMWEGDATSARYTFSQGVRLVRDAQ